MTLYQFKLLDKMEQIEAVWDSPLLATIEDDDFIYDLHAETFFVFADEQQMEQVFINIIKNAMEAIDENGAITFSLNILTRKFIIADTGKGIPKTAIEHLFSPFFSTKKDGQGIGLTLVREILINHEFNFSLETVEQGRTEFVIQF